MEYKRLNTLIHSIEQVKLLAMSMYQISDETEFRKYYLTLALQMERLTNETRTATVLDADIDRKFYAKDFRDDCLYTFENMEKNMKQDGDDLKGARFKIVIEDVSTKYSGTEYWIYVLYT